MALLQRKIEVKYGYTRFTEADQLITKHDQGDDSYSVRFDDETEFWFRLDAEKKKAFQLLFDEAGGYEGAFRRASLRVTHVSLRES